MLSLPLINHLTTAETRPAYLRWLREVRADRVFLIADANSADMALTNDEALARYRENIAYFRAHGFEVGIWLNGLGHGGELPADVYARTAHMTRICDLETGTSVSDSFCPLDPAHRTHYAANITRLASTHPDLIMIDDDLRLSGHGSVTVGCACSRHMALWNERARAAGVLAADEADMTREALAAVLLTGRPTPHRRIWLDLMGDTLRDFARAMRAAVDAVDPAIRLGHCAVLSTWDLDGVDSIELARIFAGGTKPFLRLIGAAYWENLRAFRTTNLGAITDLIRMQKAWCDAEAPDIELMSEGDVFPRPRHNVPASFVESYHQVLTAAGLPDILKYMFDYSYEPDYETGYLRLHVLKAPLREAIAEAFADTEAAGIYVFEAMHKWADADCTGLSGYDYFNRFTPASVNFMSRLGLPAAYECTRYTPTTLLFGENAKYVPAEALEANLVLDAVAAEILLKRGRGADIGLSAIQPMSAPAEETIVMPGEPARYAPTDPDARYVRLTPMEPARVLGIYDNGAPAVTAYTRADGRVVVIYAFDMESVSFDSAYMKCDARRRQLTALIEPELSVNIPEPRLYVLCRRSETKTAVGIWNFSRDIGLPQDGIRVAGMREGDTVSPVNRETVSVQDGTVSLRDEIPPFCFAGFTVHHS